MIRRMITDADDWMYSIHHGHTRFQFELEWAGRIRLTGGEYYMGEFEPQLGGSFAPDAIDRLADHLKAMAAHSRGDKN